MLTVLMGISVWIGEIEAHRMSDGRAKARSDPSPVPLIPTIRQPMRFLSSAGCSRTPHDSRGRAWAARSVQVRQHWQVSARASHGDSQEPGKDV